MLGLAGDLVGAVSWASAGMIPISLAGKGLAQRVLAVGELPGVLGRPLLGHMVRGVGGAGGEVGKERAVRHEGLLLADPVDRMIGQILCEVVALLGCRRRLNRGGSVVQRRVLVGCSRRR